MRYAEFGAAEHPSMPLVWQTFAHRSCVSHRFSLTPKSSHISLLAIVEEAFPIDPAIHHYVKSQWVLGTVVWQDEFFRSPPSLWRPNALPNFETANPMIAD